MTFDSALVNRLHAAVGEALDQRELVPAEPRGRHQRRRRDGEELAQAAIGVDTEHPNLDTAVGACPAAGDAATTSEVGNDRDGVARTGRVARSIKRQRHDLARQLVSENARVVEEGLLSCECVQVRTADPDPMDTDQGLPGPRLRRGGVREPQVAWRFTDD